MHAHILTHSYTLLIILPVVSLLAKEEAVLCPRLVVVIGF